ncbi:unnamed protein product [Arabidopsis thaliana]|uniref:Uncharacterized protein n=1 Tax=Arabidopsis thaliana TaxID=3702 RepID=Q9FMC3_ARATH|nr:unnamed protein product [Arabidopsis thaliana]
MDFLENIVFDARNRKPVGGFRGGEKKHKEILPFPSATHDKKARYGNSCQFNFVIVKRINQGTSTEKIENLCNKDHLFLEVLGCLLDQDVAEAMNRLLSPKNAVVMIDNLLSEHTALHQTKSHTHHIGTSHWLIYWKKEGCLSVPLGPAKTMESGDHDV